MLSYGFSILYTEKKNDEQFGFFSRNDQSHVTKTGLGNHTVALKMSENNANKNKYIKTKWL